MEIISNFEYQINNSNSFYELGCLSPASNLYSENTIQDFLMEYKQDQNPKKLPLLHYAIERGRFDVVDVILSIDPEQANSSTPSIKMVDEHLGNDAAHDYFYQVGVENGISALEFATKYGSAELVEKLLVLGANPSEMRTEYFNTRPRNFQGAPAKEVFWHWQENYVKRSILYWAIERNDFAMVNVLLEANSSLEGISKSEHPNYIMPHTRVERTALHQAAYVASDEILSALIAYQSNPSDWKDRVIDQKTLTLFRLYATNDQGWPPLHAALQNNDYEGFCILLELNEDIQWQGTASNSLFDMALEIDDFRFLKAMRAKGGL